MNDFYKSCAIPKPQTKKKHKKQNGWKDKPNRCCYYTGIFGAERHELFPGSGTRQICIEKGFQVDLHPAIHRLFHGIVEKAALDPLNIPGMFPEPIKWMEKERDVLQQECQRNYEEREQLELGCSPQEARERWKKLIGRNFID